MKRLLCLLLIICMASGAAFAQSSILKVDFTNTDGSVEDGYDAYYATHENESTFTAQTFSAFGTTVTVTPTWANGADAACMQMIDRGNGSTSDLEDLLRDWIGSDTRSAGDPLTLTLSGLPMGKYNWLSYHHDRDASTMGQFDVTITDLVGSMTIEDIQITGNAVTDVEEVAILETTILSNGVDDVTLVFDMHDYSNQYNEAWFLMNGFELELVSTITSAEWPVPEDGQTDVSLSPVLSWAPGQYAVTHDVYFGTSFDDVNDASRTNPGDVLVSQGQTEMTYVPGDLELDGIYYWRVDEVNEDPSTIFKGTVWTFSAEPIAFPIDGNNITAISSTTEKGDAQNTVNEAGLSNDLHSVTSSDMWLSLDCNPGEAWIEYSFDQVYTLNEMQIWNYNGESENFLGYGFKEALIEVSVDGNEWSVLEPNAVIAQAAGQSNAPVSTLIDMGTVSASAVRITALSNWSIFGMRYYGLSEVRFTSIPTAARLPVPEDGDTDVAVDQVLSWRSGRYASEHEVYLGTDVDSMTLVATVTDAEYAPDDLVYDASYVWSVSEVNQTSGKTYAGDTWSFSTPSYRVVDDMESYDDENYIYLTWADGYDDQEDDNSSQVGLDDPPYVEQDIAYDGGQSMPMYYDNKDADMYASAVKTLDGEDWTEGGLETLTLFFRGDVENEGGQLYVEVNGKKVTHEGSLDLVIWTQWNIELDSLNTDLTNVTSLTIGVDGVGEGWIFVDAIRLYREATEVAEASDPTDDNLILYYNMEKNVQDQTSNGYDGTSATTLFYADSLTEDMGQAVSLDGVADYVDMPIGNMIATLEQCCFSVWVSINTDADGGWMRAFDFGTGTSNYLFLCPRSGTAGGARFAILTPDLSWETGMTAGSSLSDGWHHLAGVFGDGTMSMYIDSQLIETVTTETYPMDMGVTTQNWLGRSQWESDAYFDGLMDELRIYDRALTAGEVRFLAGDQE